MKKMILFLQFVDNLQIKNLTRQQISEIITSFHVNDLKNNEELNLK